MRNRGCCVFRRFAARVICPSSATATIERRKAPQEALHPNGAVGFNKSPYTHRVENVGASQLYFVGVELKRVLQRVGNVSDFASYPGHQLVLENERVKVYRISLEPSQSTGMCSRVFPKNLSMHECCQTHRYAVGLDAGEASAKRGLFLSDQQPIPMIGVSEGRRFCRLRLAGKEQLSAFYRNRVMPKPDCRDQRPFD